MQLRQLNKQMWQLGGYGKYVVNSVQNRDLPMPVTFRQLMSPK